VLSARGNTFPGSVVSVPTSVRHKVPPNDRESLLRPPSNSSGPVLPPPNTPPLHSSPSLASSRPKPPSLREIQEEELRLQQQQQQQQQQQRTNEGGSQKISPQSTFPPLATRSASSCPLATDPEMSLGDMSERKPFRFITDETAELISSSHPTKDNVMANAEAFLEKTINIGTTKPKGADSGRSSEGLIATSANNNHNSSNHNSTSSSSSSSSRSSSSSEVPDAYDKEIARVLETRERSGLVVAPVTTAPSKLQSEKSLPRTSKKKAIATNLPPPLPAQTRPSPNHSEEMPAMVSAWGVNLLKPSKAPSLKEIQKTEYQNRLKQSKAIPEDSSETLFWGGENVSSLPVHMVPSSDGPVASFSAAAAVAVTTPNPLATISRDPVPLGLPEKPVGPLKPPQQRSLATPLMVNPEEFPPLTISTAVSGTDSKRIPPDNRSTVQNLDPAFVKWFKQQLKGFPSIEGMPLLEFLWTLKSTLEVTEYIRAYLGPSEFTEKFTLEFIQRSKHWPQQALKHTDSLKTSAVSKAPNDVPNTKKDENMSKKPNVLPESVSDVSEKSFVKETGTNRRVSKKKAKTRLDPGLLGFSVQTTSRVMGEIEHLD